MLLGLKLSDRKIVFFEKFLQILIHEIRLNRSIARLKLFNQKSVMPSVIFFITAWLEMKELKVLPYTLRKHFSKKF